MESFKPSFTRYLTAKKSVDDRALNRQVWDCLSAHLAQAEQTTPLRVLEVGAGTGTMLERMLDWGLLDRAHYTGLDEQPANIDAARRRLSRRLEVVKQPDPQVTVELAARDVFDFIPAQQGRQTWDLLVAHAFLDLVNIPLALPQLFSLLRPGGSFYFSLNFDGMTVFEPDIDRGFDDLIQERYHRTMDERITRGQTSGDSRSGRRLFTWLTASGAHTLAAGSSDWVVIPSRGRYPHDEAYFLLFILHTVEQALANDAVIDPERFSRWLAARRAQVARGELVYIAHQLDYFGLWQPGA
jgi:SAM-dependent methyltransferase